MSKENLVENAPLIEAVNLKKYFTIPHKGTLHAVDNVSFAINKGETLGLVGESGCGKSTVSNVIMGLHKATGGKLFFKGQDVFEASKKNSRDFYGKMQIVFQDPYSSLNPKKTVKSILSEPYLINKVCKKGEVLDGRIKELCQLVGIAPDLLSCYPHELDGGMRQVVGIARALSLNPEFIVCDEPVSSLDVSVQAKIINLLMDLQQELGLSYLFVSHDLSVVKHISNRIAVMYLGEIVEIADTDTMFAEPLHPYAIALQSAIPRVNVDKKVSRIVLKGDVPSPMDPAPVCRFAPRCWMARADCFERSAPKLEEVGAGHCVACHYYDCSRKEMENAERTSTFL